MLVLALLAAATTLTWQGLRPALDALRDTTTLLDLDGRPVVLDDPPDVAGADPVPTGGRFAAPRLGLDVPLVEMTAVGGVINPPTLTDAYLIRGFGRPGTPDSGLAVVAMHAVRGGNAAGNAFFDLGVSQSPVLVAPGDVLHVDGITYTVTRSEVLTKSAVTTSEEIWDDPEGRDGELVVLTCLQYSGATGAAEENLVIWATRAAGA